jgi:hypothetical protein
MSSSFEYEPEVDPEGSLCWRSSFIKFRPDFSFTFCQSFSEPNALSLNLGSIKAVFAIVSLNSRFTNLFAISSNILLISIWAGEVLELFINLSNTNFNSLTIFRGGCM